MLDNLLTSTSFYLINLQIKQFNYKMTAPIPE